jgi:hypothetical protein
VVGGGGGDTVPEPATFGVIAVCAFASVAAKLARGRKGVLVGSRDESLKDR